MAAQPRVNADSPAAQGERCENCTFSPQFVNVGLQIRRAGYAIVRQPKTEKRLKEKEHETAISFPDKTNIRGNISKTVDGGCAATCHIV